MEFHKLVRDKIPEMIKSQGEEAVIRILETDEYIECLEKKLDEETAEYHESKDIEELADILEVVFALAEARSCSKDELMSVYKAKNEKRGGFSKRIFLISKHEK
ncbi:MAG: nucleoside triphosphate pyrophosphohydrolase [Lachnospiraceae bacterium]|nr:nucleoside triphosphate pyrophosphohydrolase [Lachnospiraceae bacterium]